METAAHTADEPLEVSDRLVDLDLDGVERGTREPLDAHDVAAREVHIEGVAQRVRRVGAHDERVVAALGAFDSERCGRRRLADAAFAADEDEAVVGRVEQRRPLLALCKTHHRTVRFRSG